MKTSLKIYWIFLLFMACNLEGSRYPPNTLVEHSNPLLVQRNGIWYYKEALFNGFMVERERNGTLVYKLPILEGKANGTALAWYSTGEKLLKRFYSDGEKEGIFEQWWPNGHYRYLFHYKADQWEGEQTVFYPNGKIRELNHYQNGIAEGLQSAWNINGDLISNYTLRKGRVYGIIGIRSCMPVGH